MAQLIAISLIFIVGLPFLFKWLRKPIGQEITTPFEGKNPDNLKIASSVHPKDCENIKFPSKNKRHAN